MLKADFPFNINTTIDASLAETPDDPASMAEGLAWLLARAEVDTVPSAKARNLSLAGGLARSLRRYDVSADAFATADKILRQLPDQRAIAVNLIRWAHLLHWQRDFAKAILMFDSALAMIASSASMNNLRDFALQHKGKCLYDSGAIDEAIACLRAALEIRKSKGDSELIDSTEQALRACDTVKLQRHQIGIESSN